jgi:hypothetical protein
MAKLESENNYIIVECVKQDDTELDFVVKVKSYDIETTFPLTADKDDFKTFLELLELNNENMVGRAELKQRFEDKRITFELDGLLRVVDGVGEGRVIVAGCHSAFRHKGNDYQFKFIADQTALISFLWELHGIRY